MRKGRNDVVPIAFGLCAVVVFAAMGWISVTVLRLNRAEQQSRQQAAIEEVVRLALWRMDSTLTPLVAKESARPYFAYVAFYPAERAYTRMFARIQEGDVLVPSPLLTYSSPYVKLHFQLDPGGAGVTSPQVPEGNMRDLAEVMYLSHEQIEEKARALESLGRTLASEALSHALDGQSAFSNLSASETIGPISPPSRFEVQGQAVRNDLEYSARAQQQAANMAVPLSPESDGGEVQKGSLQQDFVGEPAVKVTEGAIRPLWVGNELFLARNVRVDDRTYYQGCWLDWEAIRRRLLEAIQDLLPSARLLRADSAGSSPGRLLASLPVKLEPGPILENAATAQFPVRFALAAAWVCVLLAIGAVASLLYGVVALSERRSAFVSAVTHELRTPLTTFRMYTEMLADGMVRDEEKKARYLDTLRTESDRLTRLVENVLAYARLERGHAASPMETTRLGALLERMEEHVAQRVRAGGMEFVVDMQPEVLDIEIRTDTSAVEQILMNLVDNACKYARSASDRRVHLEVSRSKETILFRVRDHGPGIDSAVAKRLFRPFSKSAKDAANSAPGVGLGLALSRRLARSLGGELRLAQQSAEGAAFDLSLPLAQPDGR